MDYKELNTAIKKVAVQVNDLVEELRRVDEIIKRIEEEGKTIIYLSTSTVVTIPMPFATSIHEVLREYSDHLEDRIMVLTGELARKITNR